MSAPSSPATRGQAINSTLVATFMFVGLGLAGSPEPLLPAVMAAFLDANPLVRVVIVTFPAVLLSLPVSVPTVLVVLSHGGHFINFLGPFIVTRLVP